VEEGRDNMHSPASDAEIATGALDSMDGTGPSAPSGAGPGQEHDGTDASVSSMPQDQLPAEPMPWPLPSGNMSPHTTDTAALLSRKPPRGSTQKKLFTYPDTPGTGICKPRNSF
jgi:hypothetical protein